MLGMREKSVQEPEISVPGSEGVLFTTDGLLIKGSSIPFQNMQFVVTDHWRPG